MSNKRKYIGYARIKLGDKNIKLDIADGALHGGAAGTYRLRVDRRVVGGFYDPWSLTQLLSLLIFDSGTPQCEPQPIIPKGTRVIVSYWHNDVPHHETTVTATPVFMGIDGKWSVFVNTYHLGCVAIACKDVRIIKK